jgi:hypothetical protein
VDTTWSHGVYLARNKILTEEGGKDDPDAVASTEKYISKCIEFGGRFVRVNPMSERVEYLYLKDGFKDEHEKMFKLEKVEQHEETLRVCV